jgi:pimeloyl-ACP methyl ester carboxylesterase
MVTSTSFEIEGGPAIVWQGGSGAAVLLIHGAWGGAQMHWSPVWTLLAERFRVVAPNLPGLADPAQHGPRTFGDYARWLERLLNAVGIQSAWVVGNSFGAAVVWQFASQFPTRSLGLVLVNGGPAPNLPTLVRQLFATAPMRQLITAVFRWNAYSRSTLQRAFADPGRAPTQLVDTLTHPSSPQLERVREAVLGDEEPYPRPQVPTLLVWGKKDRLLGSNAAAARRLSRTLGGPQLTFIPEAGHMPQVERPEQFVGELLRFIDHPRHAGA